MKLDRREFLITVAAIGGTAFLLPNAAMASEQTTMIFFRNILSRYVPDTMIDDAELSKVIADFMQGASGNGRNLLNSGATETSQFDINHEVMHWILMSTDFFDRKTSDQPLMFVRSLVLQEGACINPLARFDFD